MEFRSWWAGVAIFIVLCLPAFPFVALVRGEEPQMYTLQESIDEALKNNRAIKARKEQVSQARYAKNQARADFLPKLSTSYGYTRLDKVEESSPTTVNSSRGTFTIPGEEQNALDNYQFKISVDQPLFTGFALTSSFRIAELDVDRSRMELRLEELALALRVKEAYFGILKAEKTLQVAKQAVDFYESNVKLARDFHKVGMIPVNDVLKAEVKLAKARHDLVEARNALRLARSNFNIVLSRPINSPANVEDVLVFKPVQGEFTDYVKKALETRPEIRLLETRIHQADQQVRLAESGLYPEIALGYDYIREGDSADVSGSPFHDSERWEAKAVLSWDFWQWGKTYYGIREKESLKREFIQTKQAMEDKIRLQVKEALLGLEEAEENIPTTRKAVEQARENLRVMRKRYKAQVTTMTEVLDAQTMLTEARMNYFHALYSHHLAKARLERALGTY